MEPRDPMLCLLLAPCSPGPLNEAMTSGASVVVADLTMEVDMLERRRAAVVVWLREARGQGARPALYVRIHDLMSGRAEDDLDAVFPAAPHGILLPCCRSVEDVQRLGAKLAVREAEHGLPDGAIRIVAAPASSAAAALALEPYARAGNRLAGLIWDGEDLARDLSLGAADDASPVVVARALTILAARAAGVPALDTVVGTKPDDVTQDCLRARRDGFLGALTRDPGQARLIAAAYAPSLKIP